MPNSLATSIAARQKYVDRKSLSPGVRATPNTNSELREAVTQAAAQTITDN